MRIIFQNPQISKYLYKIIAYIFGTKPLCMAFQQFHVAKQIEWNAFKCFENTLKFIKIYYLPPLKLVQISQPKFARPFVSLIRSHIYGTFIVGSEMTNYTGSVDSE